MREAGNDLGAAERSNRQITERKQGRQKAIDRGKLAVRTESGNSDAFSRGSQVQHRIDPARRALGQEINRPRQAALNQRPSQRIHPNKGK